MKQFLTGKHTIFIAEIFALCSERKKGRTSVVKFSKIGPAISSNRQSSDIISSPIPNPKNLVMRNRVHGSGTMRAPGKKGDGSSLNLTAHINSRERVSFHRYKSRPRLKGFLPDVRVGDDFLEKDSMSIQ